MDEFCYLSYWALKQPTPPARWGITATINTAAKRHHTQTSKSSLPFVPQNAPTVAQRQRPKTASWYQVKVNRGFSSSILFGFYGLSSAHMQLTWRPALRSKYNLYTAYIDYDMKSRLSRLAAPIFVSVAA
jgi:hypothetical protein